MRTVSLFAIALVALIGLGATEATAQSSVWGSSNGVLVFRSDRDGEPDLFTVDAGGSGAENLDARLRRRRAAAGMVAHRRPDRVRAAGRHHRSRGPVRGERIGGGRTRLTSTPVPERDPSWSSNGTRVVYSARTQPGEPFRIFVVKADGSGREQLTTQSAGSADRSPVWSPDGTRIAFVSNRDGGFPRALHHVRGRDRCRAPTPSNSLIDANPSWSPDGGELVFERCCEGKLVAPGDLFAIDVATRAEVNLSSSGDHQEFDPVWSPDGTRIAFVSFAVGQGNLDIWVMNADGSDPVRLTQEAGPDPLPRLATAAHVHDRRDRAGRRPQGHRRESNIICALGSDSNK